jgi:hypothetical protein
MRYVLPRRLRAFVGSETPVPAFENVPCPPSERGHWLFASVMAALGATLLAAVLTGVIGRAQSSPAPPPPVLVAAVTPAPSQGSASATTKAAAANKPGALIAKPSAAQQSQSLERLEDPLQTYVSTRWMEGFYPIYSVAQETFGVNWLLIASIHDQETAFSTAPSTYHGLNYAGCCGGPMQFNVTNGQVGTSGRAGTPSTWDLVADSYIYGPRPASYNHMTAHHPSIYDDFDSIMAAAHLLSSDGATFVLNEGSWDAAYDYYGHDSAGVAYADEVLARAIGWSQHGFCANCGVEPAMISAVYAAYGAPVLAALQAEEATAAAAAQAAAKSRSAAQRAKPTKRSAHQGVAKRT